MPGDSGIKPVKDAGRSPYWMYGRARGRRSGADIPDSSGARGRGINHLRLDRDCRLRRGDVEAEALLQVEANLVGVVVQVSDGEVLAGLEEEVVAAHADHDGALQTRRPDQLALDDLAQVLEQRIAAVLSGLHHLLVLLVAQRQRVGAADAVA